MKTEPMKPSLLCEYAFLNSQLSEAVALTAGAEFQNLKKHNTIKKVIDLLGGDFWRHRYVL